MLGQSNGVRLGRGLELDDVGLTSEAQPQRVQRKCTPDAIG
jgi:hypothetical protein